jgi:hypothetical protein
MFALQVNFDAERFVDYINRADAYQQSIKTKLAQAGVKARPSAAALPWFDLQGSPLDFDLKKALKGQPVNAQTLEALGQEVSESTVVTACQHALLSRLAVAQQLVMGCGAPVASGHTGARDDTKDVRLLLFAGVSAAPS